MGGAQVWATHQSWPRPPSRACRRQRRRAPGRPVGIGRTERCASLYLLKMPHPLTFVIRETYDTLQDGITLETVLRAGEESIVCRAKIDTGAQVCLFKREIGEKLGLE